MFSRRGSPAPTHLANPERRRSPHTLFSSIIPGSHRVTRKPRRATSRLSSRNAQEHTYTALHAIPQLRLASGLPADRRWLTTAAAGGHWLVGGDPAGRGFGTNHAGVAASAAIWPESRLARVSAGLETPLGYMSKGRPNRATRQGPNFSRRDRAQDRGGFGRIAATAAICVAEIRPAAMLVGRGVRQHSRPASIRRGRSRQSISAESDTILPSRGRPDRRRPAHARRLRPWRARGDPLGGRRRAEAVGWRVEPYTCAPVRREVVDAKSPVVACACREGFPG